MKKWFLESSAKGKDIFIFVIPLVRVLLLTLGAHAQRGLQ